MFENLRNHPFEVKAFFESSMVLTFALPKEQLKNCIPECLTLDTYHDQWAFMAVAVVQTRGLRPRVLPEILGKDFLLIGYRIFVKYKNQAGRQLRGLYILKSETDRKSMQFLGNIFTHYNYSTVKIRMTTIDSRTNIFSSDTDFQVEIDEVENAPIPDHSPFLNWIDARKFLGPMPFTFNFKEQLKEVTVIEGVRKNWNPKPIKVIHYSIPFLSTQGWENAVLANAFVTRKTPYYWKKGVVEKWKP